MGGSAVDFLFFFFPFHGSTFVCSTTPLLLAVRGNRVTARKITGSALCWPYKSSSLLGSACADVSEMAQAVRRAEREQHVIAYG
jgi:hypothetical protein